MPYMQVDDCAEMTEISGAAFAAKYSEFSNVAPLQQRKGSCMMQTSI
jgi:hypothetical protein